MMDMRIEGLVMRAIGKDYQKIAQKLAELVDAGWDKCHIYKCLYKHIFEGHLQPDECEHLVGDVHTWTIEDTDSVARNLDYDFSKKPYSRHEFWAAMNIMHGMISSPLKESGTAIESTSYGRITDKWLSSDDNVLTEKYFHMCK